jgi:hypothetical protein
MALPETNTGILLADPPKNNCIVSLVDWRRLSLVDWRRHMNVCALFFGVPDELLLATDTEKNRTKSSSCMFGCIYLYQLEQSKDGTPENRNN